MYALASVDVQDDGRVAVGTGSGLVQLRSAASGELLGDGSEHGGNPVRVVASSPDGELVASGASDGSLVIWTVSGAGGISPRTVTRGHGASDS